VHVDALAGVIPRSTLYLQVRDRAWTKLHPGVVALPGAPDIAERRIAAAVLATGGPEPAAWADRWTALWLWGLLRRAPSTVHLVVPRAGARPRRRRVDVRRSAALPPEHLTEVRGLPVTTAARTLADMAPRTKPAFLRGLVVDARQRGLTDLEDVARVLDTLRNATGAGLLRRLLWELDEVRCDSILEALVRDLLRRAGLPQPHPEPYAVSTGSRTLHLDIAWPALRCGIEVDGMGYHSARDHLDRDQRRHNALVLAGWRVLRVGWYRVEADAAAFIREVRALLAA
jgi:hypothetical protein